MLTLARLTYRHAGIVIACTGLAFAAAVILASDVFDRVQPFDIDDEGSENVAAASEFESATGRSADPGVLLLVPTQTPGAEDPPATLAARRLRATPGIARVASPHTNPALVSADGSQALVFGYLEEGAGRVEVGESVVERFASTPDLVAGGTAVAAYQVGLRSEEDTRRLELYATPVLLLLLLFVFRTAIAALLPLIVATLSILIAFAALRLLTDLTPIDLFALQTVTGLGVGLAIDYSLFILARHRQEIDAGRTREEAHVQVMATAGRTVAFSSLTVASALIALTVFPQPFLRSTGIAGALTALFAGVISLLVLPAILAKLGSSVESYAIRRGSTGSGLTGSDDFWRRLSKLVCRRPLPAIVGGVLALLALSTQAFGMDLTTPDAQDLPPEESARVVSDSLDEFPGIPPTQLFAIVPISTDERSLVTGLEQADGVVGTSRLRALDDDSAQLMIYGEVDPLSSEGQQLVADARSALPSGSLLGGRAAEQADQRASIIDYAPLAIAIVVLSNLALLAAMTRSLLLPFLALATNLLSVAASLGVLALIFTTELGAGLLGIEVQTGIDMSVPVIAFAVGFGLSTDYGIFLFSRIREERTEDRTEEEAIVEGLAATGRLISASAVLLAVAVGVFIFSDLVIVKEFAVAIAVAVLLDATVIRGLLTPALLKSLGGRVWWPGGSAPGGDVPSGARGLRDA